jgi:hypothetical protein
MSGQGPESEAFVVLHGQPGTGHDWARVVALLDHETPAVAPDRAGWEGHTGPRRPRGQRSGGAGGAGHLLLQLRLKRLAEVMLGRERVSVA